MNILLDDYINYLRSKNYKPRGIEEQKRAVKKYIEYAEDNNINIFTIGIKEAEAYREHLRLNSRYNPKTINYKISFLRLFYSFLITKEKSFTNPFKNIERMKESFTLPRNILKIDQMKKLLDGIEVNDIYDFKFKVIVELLYSTGARISEIENLKPDDIDLTTGYIIINDDKERQDRKAVLTEYSTQLLKIYMKHLYDKDNITVFYHGKKRTLNKWVNTRLKKVCNKLKLPVVTCHGIRHITATHLFKNGADIREVQEYLGHRRIKNTEIYTKIFPDDLKEVVEKNHPRARIFNHT